jgi:molybdopterin converting factor small subunit
MPRVFIPAQLRDLTGGQTDLDVAGASVREIVAELERQFPGIAARLCQNDELSAALQISIDGTLSRRGLDAKVPPGSEVHFLPVFGGG